MQRVILHLGFHKTGTSHVQRTLRANARALAPYVETPLKRDMTTLIQIARSYSALRDVLGLARVAEEFRSLLKGLGKTPCLVLSAEELSGHMPGRPRVPDYSAAPVLAEVYCSILRQTWPDAAIILHYGTRDADAWLESAYWEHVKSSSLTMELDAFCTRYRRAADLGAIVAQVADLGLTVQTTPLESATSRFGPAGPVLELCDLPPTLDLVPQPPQNTRLPQPLLLDLLAANRAYPERSARKAAKAAILARAET